MWTKQPPAEDGYYWHRFGMGEHAETVRITSGWMRRPGDGACFVATTYGGEWYGPLKAPDGAADEDFSREEVANAS